ncbi:MAG: zinc-binding alcohol dehydrogenase [Salinibacterium sp.]|nr:zinc-binding alcohol dehydrogenase [Salinibacterium sp.]
MTSLDIIFPAPNTVRLVTSTVAKPGDGELLCEAQVSLLSTGTETFCLAGEFDAGTFWEEWVEYPFAPGYSMTSTVIEVGSGVTRFSVGDRVASQTPHAQRFTVPAEDAVRIPDDITCDQAAWMSLACTTQLGVRRAELHLGETVAVVGLGLLGQLAVQYLRLAGAGRIIGIDTSPQRLKLAEKHGATDLICAGVVEAKEAVAKLTGGRMVDVVFDITGHHSVLAPASALLRPLGRLVLLGDSPSPSLQTLGPRIVADSISILGVHASSAPAHATLRDPWTLEAMTELFFLFLRTGRMDVDGLVSHRFSPDQAPEVYAQLQRDRSAHLGTLFDWTGLAP